MNDLPTLQRRLKAITSRLPAPFHRATPGNQGVWVLQRTEAGQTEFLLISLWQSWNDIKRFAGENYQQAVYYPDDPNFLIDLPPNVEHYEVLVGR